MKRILIVDDEPTTRKILAKQLEPTGWEIETASSGTTALQLCQTMDIDCLLLDLFLPDITGLQVLEILRSKRTVLPIIIITGNETLESAASALRLGAQDYLIKGTFKGPLLIRAIQNAVEKFEQYQEAQRLQRTLNELSTAYEKLEISSQHQQKMLTDLSERVPSGVASEPQHLNILIVDDEPNDQFFLKRVIANINPDFDVQVAGSIETGMRFAKNHSIDCILSDHLLPDGTSLDFLEQLQNLDQFQGAVIVLTGQGNEEIAVKALKLGASDYIIKNNISADLLKSTLFKAMALIHESKERRKALLELSGRNLQLRDEIDSRTAVEEQLQVYKTLVEETLDYVFIVDPQTGRIIHCSNSVRSLLKATGEAENYKDFDKACTQKRWTEIVAGSWESKGRLLVESQFVSKEGQTISVEILFKGFKSAAQQYMMIIARDITHRLQLEQRLLALAMTDALTGLYNRRHFDDQLKKNWRLLIREKSYLSLLMIDVDYFKKYNDHYGHLEGDICLKKISKAILDCLKRPMDFAARYGGEEMAVVLPFTQKKGAISQAKKILAAIRQLALPHADSPFPHVTASIGISTMVPSSGQKPDLILAQADQALYQAKEAGRNRVLFFDDND
jgi:diguanylate cyclase (GGDEF)-like protein